MKSATQEKSTGREPESRLVKAIKASIIAKENYDEIDLQLQNELNLSGKSTPTSRDKEVLQILEERFELNKMLDPMLVKIFPLSRNKNRTDEEDVELALLQDSRDKIHATLYKMPRIGMTNAAFNREQNKKEKLAKFHGRPPISLEMKHIRASSEFTKAFSKFSLLSKKGAGREEIVKILGAEIKEPKIEDLLKIKDQFFSSKTVGRFSGGNVTKLERDLRLVRKKIQHIESGEEEAERKAKTETRTSMGRPFEDLDVKLTKLQEKEQGILNNINKEEKNMSPLDLSHRKIVLLRKDIKEYKKTLEDEGIDEILDKEHPLSIEYNRLNYVLARIVQRRSVLLKESEYVNELAASSSNIAVSQEDSLKKEEIEKAKIKKEKIERAKLIKEKAQKAINLKNAQSKGVDKSETDALKSIIG